MRKLQRATIWFTMFADYMQTLCHKQKQNIKMVDLSF